MFDASLVKDLTEMMGKSLTFKDVEAVGGYLFKDHGFSSHQLAGVDRKLSISPLNAARTLAEECERTGRLEELFAFVFELNGVPLNGRNVRLEGLENLLFSLVRSGSYYEFGKRRFVDHETRPRRKRLPGWGVLRSGWEYLIAIVSVDICQNSSLVKKHSSAVMERVYYRMWDFFKHRLDAYEGRMWSWAGDGGLLAFRGGSREAAAVSCCLEILYTLPVFNLQPDKPIRDDICLRIGIDSGPVKFVKDTGRIVSEVINYAVHLEKNGTSPGALSVSAEVFDRLPKSLRSVFTVKREFEGRTVHATA
jgi:class 3 adenylate cyclase